MDVSSKNLNKNYEEDLSKEIEKCKVYKEDNLLKNKIICSKLQTKDWRKKQDWYITGKKNECEIYQRALIENIVIYKCKKQTNRLNLLSFELKEYKNPMKYNDGFEWTEDFDGFINEYNMYINFKMICDRGGSQTRSLREVYHFITTQLNYLKQNINKQNILFINILDGDESYRNINKFKYLLSKPEYLTIKNIFVGDMKTFYDWFNIFITQ